MRRKKIRDNWNSFVVKEKKIRVTGKVSFKKKEEKLGVTGIVRWKRKEEGVTGVREKGGNWNSLVEKRKAKIIS